MPLGTIVMLAAAVAVLGYIWWRTRRSPERPFDRSRAHGRGLTDEAVTALENVTSEITDGPELSAPPRANRADRRHRVDTDGRSV